MTDRFSECVIDIETIGDIPPDLLKKMVRKLKAPGGWKDPEKIAANLKKQEEKLIEKAALNPRTGRIVAVGLAFRAFDLTESCAEWDYYVYTDRTQDEQKLLTAVDVAMYRAAPILIAGFDLRRFDLPFLVARAMRHRLILTHPWPVGHDRRIVDMYEVLGKNGGLDDWGLTILGRGKEGSGGDVAYLVENEKWDTLAEYCKTDLELAAALYDLYRGAAER